MIEENKFSAKSLTFLYKMKYLNRYEAYPRITYETVAEHSYFVAFYTMLICDKLGLADKISNVAIKIALNHDVPEIILSDIPHDSKEVLNDLGVDMKGIEERIMLSLFPEYSMLVHSFEQQGDMPILPAIIVKAADALSVIQYCLHELSLGNSNMKPIYESALARYRAVLYVLNNRFGFDVTEFDAIIE